MAQFPDTIKFYNRDDASAFKIDWQLSFDGVAFSSIGETKHQIYLTLEKPNNGLRYESLLYIGSKSADGESEPAAAVAEIWSEFTESVGDGVSRVDGVPMGYYKNNTASVGTLSALLGSTHGSGVCDAWADLLKGVLDVLGIEGGEIVSVRSNYTNSDSGDGEIPDPTRLITKEFNFDGDGSAPQACAPFDYLESDLMRVNGGFPGQKQPNPPFDFVGHCIVSYADSYYDPSYGKGPYDFQEAYENAAISAFVNNCRDDENTLIDTFKQNDENTLETIFSD